MTEPPYDDAAELLLSHFQKRVTDFQKRYPPETLGGKLAEALVYHLLGFDAIDAIFTRMIERNPGIGRLLNAIAENHETKTLASMWFITRKTAIEMIDEENPKHIARSTLAGEV